MQKESTFTLDLPKPQPKNQKNIILRQQKIFTYKKNSFLVGEAASLSEGLECSWANT